MDKTEQKIVESIEKATALIKKLQADHAAEIASLKAKIKDQESEELEESVKPEYQIDMKGNLIRILYDRFQIKKPKKQHGKVNKHRLAFFMHATPQTLYNLQNGKGGAALRRVYHAVMLMSQKLSDKDLRDIVRDLKTYDYDQ